MLDPSYVNYLRSTATSLRRGADGAKSTLPWMAKVFREKSLARSTTTSHPLPASLATRLAIQLRRRAQAGVGSDKCTKVRPLPCHQTPHRSSPYEIRYLTQQPRRPAQRSDFEISTPYELRGGRCGTSWGGSRPQRLATAGYREEKVRLDTLCRATLVTSMRQCFEFRPPSLQSW